MSPTVDDYDDFDRPQSTQRVAGEHTPGPWEIDHSSYGEEYWFGGCEHDCYRVGPAIIGQRREQTTEDRARLKADAHLIASAPEMLQALSALLDREERITEHGECDLCYATPNFVAEGDIIHADDCPLELIRAAIARARGLA